MVIMPQTVDDIELTSGDRELIGRFGRQFVLDRNERAPYIHTTRRVSSHQSFRIWTPKRANADCLHEVIHEIFSQPILGNHTGKG
jgi:hypothetical protein